MGLPRCSSASAAATWIAGGAIRYAGGAGSRWNAPGSVDERHGRGIGYRTRHVCITGGEPLWLREPRADIPPDCWTRKVVVSWRRTAPSPWKSGLPDHPELMDQHGLQVPILRWRTMLEDGTWAAEAQGPAEVRGGRQGGPGDGRDVVVKNARPDCPVILTPVGGLTAGPVVSSFSDHAAWRSGAAAAAQIFGATGAASEACQSLSNDYIIC